jgi:hypothetical protein
MKRLNNVLAATVIQLCGRLTEPGVLIRIGQTKVCITDKNRGDTRIICTCVKPEPGDGC